MTSGSAAIDLAEIRARRASEKLAMKKIASDANSRRG
jgi:hypothetical protein